MKFENLKFSCGVKVGEYIYASCLELNRLCKISTKSEEYEFLDPFPDEYETELHRNAVAYHEKIFFVSQKKNRVHVYDLETGSISIIDFGGNEYSGGYIGKNINSKLYLIPQKRGGNIYSLDMKNFKVEVFITWNQYKEMIQSSRYELLFIRIADNLERIYMPVYEGNEVLILDVNTKTMKRIELELKNLFGCFNGKNRIWLLTQSGNEICSLDVNNNKITHYYHSTMHDRKKGRELNWIVEVKDSIYAFPSMGDIIYRSDKDEFKPFRGQMNETIFKSLSSQKSFEPIVDKEEQSIWLLPKGEDFLLYIKNNKIILRNYLLDKSSDEYKLSIHNYFAKKQSKPFIEGNDLTLLQFIGGINFL